MSRDQNAPGPCPLLAALIDSAHSFTNALPFFGFASLMFGESRMRRTLLPAIVVSMALLCGTAWAQSGAALNVYFIDVEGGQSTLLVSPSGQSLLVDAGWPGSRDADRIADIAKQAGIKQI